MPNVFFLFCCPGTEEERINLYNAVRSSTRAKRFFRYPEKSLEDVSFQLMELERVPIGESFDVVVQLKVIVK